jgi:hypothetical protein
MLNLGIEHLRSLIDQESKYVDFSILRAALPVEKIVRDLNIELTKPTEEGECRGKCPKCSKTRSFALNVNTNRFNCFNKGCFLKGGGAIDFFAKLYEVPAKEASHLLACAYSIQPYSKEQVSKIPAVKKTSPKATPAQPEQSPSDRETVSRKEFDELGKKVEGLTTIVWSMMLENREVSEQDLFDESLDYETEPVMHA